MVDFSNNHNDESNMKNVDFQNSAEFNSVKKLLQLLIGATISDVKPVTNTIHPLTSLHSNGHLNLTPNLVLNFIYHGDTSGVDADKMENDQPLLNAADLLISFRNKIMGIQIPIMKGEMRSLHVPVNYESR